MYNYSEPLLPDIPLTQLNNVLHSTMYTYITSMICFLLIIFGGVIYFLLNVDSGYHFCNCCKDSQCVITAEHELTVETQV